MAYNDFVTNIQNADIDAQALSKFMQGANSEVVKRRIANDIKTLQYYLDYLHGLELVYSQTDGFVDVNGTQVKTVTQAIKDAINAAQAQNGLGDALVSVKNSLAMTGGVDRTLRDKLSDFVSVKDFGAKGDGVTDDYAAIQKALDYAGKGGRILFNKTTANTYCISQPLKFYNGQTWIGSGGVDVQGLGTQIKLVANATSVTEPKAPATVTYGFNPIGIYFNAQNFGDCGLSLYNTSYANVDQCSASCNKTGGAAFLLDSDTSKQCYFNKINQPRGFAKASGAVCMRFTRGANANQVFGGKFGSSTRGMEFLSLSAGNLIIATDFEENTDRHIYVDAPSNTFIATHMEFAPIGFDITSNGSDTRRISTSFASSVTTPVQSASNETIVHEVYPSGLASLNSGVSKQTTQYYTTSVSQNNDYELPQNTENVVTNYFRYTNSSSPTKRVNWYRANGTATLSHQFDLTNGSILQTSNNGFTRVIARAATTTGMAGNTGDVVLRTNPSLVSPVTAWTCITSGSPGTWQASSWVVTKGNTASRPSCSTADIGVMYLDTTLTGAGKPIVWDGSKWLAMDGSPADSSNGVSVTYDPPSIATGTQVSTTVTYTGANFGDIVAVSFGNSLQGMRIWGEVTASGVITVYIRNDTGNTLDIGSGTLRVKIL